MDQTARVIEVFSSIQGEGIYIGQPHLFVRFWDCNLACRYCDTDYRGPYVEYTEDQLLEEVKHCLDAEGPFHAVSLTGGEPLLWWRFLKGWLPRLKLLGVRTYLETNGTLPGPLAEVLPWIDIIAMDLKPPTATADRAVWEEQEAFLRVANGATNGARHQNAHGVPGLRPGTQSQNGVRHHFEVFVKIVVTPQTSDHELQRAFDLVADVDREIPVVLQPVTPWGQVQEAPRSEQLNRWHFKAGRQLRDVRVIPQLHRLIGVP